MAINKILHTWVYNFFSKQITTIILAALILYFFKLYNWANSLILGAICNLLPAIFMAYFSFRKCGATKSKAILQDFLYGELTKFCLTSAFILIILTSFAINVYAFFLGFLLIAIGYVWIPVLMDKDR